MYRNHLSYLLMMASGLQAARNIHSCVFICYLQLFSVFSCMSKLSFIYQILSAETNTIPPYTAYMLLICFDAKFSFNNFSISPIKELRMVE